MSLDMHMRVYLGHTSDYIEICPDADGIGMIEVRHIGDEGKIGDRILVDLENVDDLVTAIKTVSNHMQGLLQK